MRVSKKHIREAVRIIGGEKYVGETGVLISLPNTMCSIKLDSEGRKTVTKHKKFVEHIQNDENMPSAAALPIPESNTRKDVQLYGAVFEGLTNDSLKDLVEVKVGLGSVESALILPSRISALLLFTDSMVARNVVNDASLDINGMRVDAAFQQEKSIQPTNTKSRKPNAGSHKYGGSGKKPFGSAVLNATAKPKRSLFQRMNENPPTQRRRVA